MALWASYRCRENGPNQCTSLHRGSYPDCIFPSVATSLWWASLSYDDASFSIRELRIVSSHSPEGRALLYSPEGPTGGTALQGSVCGQLRGSTKLAEITRIELALFP